MMYPFSLHYSDDNKKNTFNSGGNNGHWLTNFMCEQIFTVLYEGLGITLRVSVSLLHCTGRSVPAAPNHRLLSGPCSRHVQLHACR